MDDEYARSLAAKLVGSTLGGWQLTEYINHGKSAVVLRGSSSTGDVAVKVFDPALVARFGREAQLKRIEREKQLIGRSHPNLVCVFGGGEERGYLFVSMELFPGSNLADSLTRITADRVRPLIAQIASAAQFLESCAFAHRDIKPANIGVAPDLSTAKLLDLGVIRPLDLSNVTDEGDQKLFIGTLQYSPPELLFREEEQSVEAWRAITFYQLGAVLHDLLTLRPLFLEESTPYGRLVRAVGEKSPRLDGVGIDSELRLLALNCLAKSPTHRLNTVKWEHFQESHVADPLDSARRKIAARRGAARIAAVGENELTDQVAQQAYSLRTAIQAAVVSTINSESLPRYSTQVIRDPDPFLLRILFEPSVTDGLEVWFAFYCFSQVVDPAGSIHLLGLSSCVAGNRDQIPAEATKEAIVREVRGALIDQDIRTQVQQSLILAYAQALQETEASLESIRWIDVRGEK